MYVFWINIRKTYTDSFQVQEYRGFTSLYFYVI